VRGRQGANRTAMAVALPAMSSIPSLMFISLVCSYLYLSILHRITSPSRTLAWDPSKGASLRVLRLAQGASRPLEAPKVRGTLMVGHQRP
jgi:hypothetical protein